MQFSQDSAYNVTATTLSSSSTTIPPTFTVGGPTDAGIVGAVLGTGGKMTPYDSTYDACAFSTHFNPTATQLPVRFTIIDTGYPGNGYSFTGTMQ
jgi:hypothetical protein